MANRANLIATYNANPTLQSRYTLPQYLNMFGFDTPATTTPTTPAFPTTPTPTPVTPGVTNIINQNIDRGGGDGGPQNIPERVQYFDKTYTGATFPDGTPIMGGFEETEGPGFFDQLGNAMDGLVGLYQQYSPFGMIGRKIEQNKQFKQAQTDKALEQVAIQQAIREAEAAEQARLANAVTYQYNNPSARAPQDDRDRRADAFTGGGANVAAASYTDRGREGFGYGLASGGRVGLENGGQLSESDFPFLINKPGENMGRKKPGLDYYDKYEDSPDDEYPIIEIPMGKMMKKKTKKKKKEKKFADGGRVYLYNRLK